MIWLSEQMHRNEENGDTKRKMNITMVSGKTHGLLRFNLEYFHLDHTVCLKENSEHYSNIIHPNKSTVERLISGYAVGTLDYC